MKNNSSNPKFVPVENRPATFEGKKNVFIAPSKPLVAMTLKRDVVISKSLKELGQIPNVNTIDCPKVQDGTGKRKKIAENASASASAPKGLIKPTFTEAHVLSDQLFITYTSKMSIHDKGGKALFYANGGGEIVHLHTTLAFAWEALRKQKLSSIMGIKPSHKPYSRADVIDMTRFQVYRSPLQRDPHLRSRAREEAVTRAQDQLWLRSNEAKRT